MPKRSSCPVKPTLEKRRLISIDQAIGVMDLFGVLANDTRLRIVHALAKEEELCVSEIAEQLDMKVQAISNQLQRLADKKILRTRREGNSIHYRIVDPCVTALLDLGLCLIEDAKG